jgi:hypothetical protein
MPVTVAIAKAAIPIAGGIYQNIKANKLNKKNKRPTYNVDGGYQTNVDEAAALAKGRTRQFSNAEAKADQAMANSAELAKGFSGNNTSMAIGSLIAAQNQRNEAQRDVLGAESAFQANAMQNLASQRQALAEENDKAFNYNLNMPYQNTREQAINLRNSGNALIGQGIQSGFDSAEGQMGGMLPRKAKASSFSTSGLSGAGVDLITSSSMLAKKGIKKVKAKK